VTISFSIYSARPRFSYCPSFLYGGVPGPSLRSQRVCGAVLVSGIPACTGEVEYRCARVGYMTQAEMDALRQASLALSESELLFCEGLTEYEVEALSEVKSALSAAISAESPQTTLSTIESMRSRYPSLTRSALLLAIAMYEQLWRHLLSQVGRRYSGRHPQVTLGPCCTHAYRMRTT